MKWDKFDRPPCSCERRCFGGHRELLRGKCIILHTKKKSLLRGIAYLHNYVHERLDLCTFVMQKGSRDIHSKIDSLTYARSGVALEFTESCCEENEFLRTQKRSLSSAGIAYLHNYVHQRLDACTFGDTNFCFGYAEREQIYSQ
ncbi:hypothetical protein CDAR_593491 [Caerostris darwini]|uniref:Uncharacterized protein n=1 Tax=Caerostris darwini TaxID=1538125 RepID=A0AAV4RXX7_9ARAC|nr:hypothetical protein CDAR_593491 [Caerostris darwini]